MSVNKDSGSDKEDIRLALREMRRSYSDLGFEPENLPTNPFPLFKQWLTQAAGNEFIVEANAMVLTTYPDSNTHENNSTLLNNSDVLNWNALTRGAPISRTVLLKDLEKHSLTFFTNYDSRKAHNIENNNKVSLLFPWYAMERQIYIAGSVEKISEKDSDNYFAIRPYGSQIGAWASAQSHILRSREDLENAYAQYSVKYPEGSSVPRPPHWGGYRVTPFLVEFWQGRYSRLHDRILYALSSENSSIEDTQDRSALKWSMTRLNP